MLQAFLKVSESYKINILHFEFKLGGVIILKNM